MHIQICQIQISPVSILLVSIMSSRRLQDMSSRHLQDMSSRRLEDVLKTSKCLLGAGCSAKGADHCSLDREVSNNYFEKVLLINFISTWSKSLQDVFFRVPQKTNCCQKNDMKQSISKNLRVQMKNYTRAYLGRSSHH